MLLACPQMLTVPHAVEIKSVDCIHQDGLVVESGGLPGFSRLQAKTHTHVIIPDINTTGCGVDQVSGLCLPRWIGC